MRHHVYAQAIERALPQFVEDLGTRTWSFEMSVLSWGISFETWSLMGSPCFPFSATMFGRMFAFHLEFRGGPCPPG